MGPLSVVVLVAVGAGRGVLETRHLAGRGLKLTANLVAGAVGAVGGGLFFHIWGGLAPGLLEPTAAGAIGAAFVLPALNWIVIRLKA